VPSSLAAVTMSADTSVTTPAFSAVTTSAASTASGTPYGADSGESDCSSGTAWRIMLAP